MLGLFRKYQRVLFMFVTVVVILTFSLFGSYKTFGRGGGTQEIVVGHAIDGSKLKYHEIKQLSALLGAEPVQTGVMGREFLMTGVGDELASKFFDSLKAEWQSRLERAKRCHFYVHPAAAVIDTHEMWNHAAPGAMEELRLLQAMEEAGPEFFAHWVKLFALQEQCPPGMVQRMVLYYQNQLQVPSDPRIMSEDFSLLGFRTMHDWLGTQWMDLTAQYIFNGAIIAEKQGFRATRQEALQDLARRLSSKDHNLDWALRSAGVSKETAVCVWQKALGFLRYMQALSKTVAVDELPHRTFADFAHETAAIDQVSLPKELQLKTLDDFLAFEIYNRQVCVPSKDIRAFPQALRSVDEAANVAPELVSTPYCMSAAQLDLKAMRSHVSMREVWNWQLADANWQALTQAFPEIAAGSGNDRFQLLEQLSSIRHAVVDDWTRRQIVAAHPEWVERELADAPAKECTMAIFANGDIDGLAIQQGHRFQELLEKAIAGDAPTIEALRTYREEDLVWRISAVSRPHDRSVLSWADASRLGRINVDHYLEDRYHELREEAPELFQDQNGDWMNFHSARETVIRTLFAPLFAAIDSACGEVQDEKPLAFYAQYRFYPFMQRQRAALEAGEALSDGLWGVVRSEETVNRATSTEWMVQQPFIVPQGKWSSVHVSADGNIVFFRVKDRQVAVAPVSEAVQKSQELLAAEVKCRFARQLLTRALDKQAIVACLRTEKDD